jgi:hypothetical protein
LGDRRAKLFLAKNSMSLTWQIVQDPTASTSGIRVAGSNPNAAWPYFFNGFIPANYPKLLESVAQEIGFHSNGTGVNFPLGLLQADPTRPPIEADKVEVYLDGFETSVLPRATFYAILSAFAERLLVQPGQPPAWYEAMQAAIAALQVKRATDATSE